MENENMITQAQHETLLAAAVTSARTEATVATTAALTTDHTNALNAAVATATAAGATAERERISAILALPEAQGREGGAMHMAMTTTMTAEQVKPVLAGLPTGHAAKLAQANGLGLVVDKPLNPAAAGGDVWDKSLQRAGATLPGKKSA